jgi:hypothetical protein
VGGMILGVTACAALEIGLDLSSGAAETALQLKHWRFDEAEAQLGHDRRGGDRRDEVHEAVLESERAKAREDRTHGELVVEIHPVADHS